jgi:hypothetical protein
VLQGRKTRGKVDGGGSLTHPTFLVANRDDLCRHKASPVYFINTFYPYYPQLIHIFAYNFQKRRFLMILRPYRCFWAVYAVKYLF